MPTREQLKQALDYFRPSPHSRDTASIVLTVGKMREHLAVIEAALSRSDPDQDAIETDPCRRSGIPVLKGTRFTVAQIVAEIAETTAPDDLAERFETLDASTVRRGLEELALRLDRPNALARSDPDAVAAARAETIERCAREAEYEGELARMAMAGGCDGNPRNRMKADICSALANRLRALAPQESASCSD